ncbi:MAG TPA: amidohydrolase family protein [Candidatus Acidoferrales bacterium]|nr:amidohydrolase family protein [Candidatus Acidoferrales bacterium]
MKIDVFCHIFPRNYYERMLSVSGKGAYMQKRVREIPGMIDLDQRFRMMDRFDDYVQVISTAAPPIEALANPGQSAELARVANDGMAELVVKHPDRFPGFIASLPMNDSEATVRETERAILELGAAGVQIYTNVNGRPLDEPEFLPFFAKMAELDRPVWMHPSRPATFADYQNEQKSKYELWWVFGWPYETSIAMSRILFAGYFDRFPNLKIITHHMGGMIPYFAGRIGPGLDQLGARTEDENLALVGRKLKKRPIDYYRMFYADTALFGAREAMVCGLDFFGADQTLFASDSPFDPEKGPGFIRETIRCLEQMDISIEDRKKIYEGNARRLLRLKLA